jgi:hypothetical protein
MYASLDSPVLNVNQLTARVLKQSTISQLPVLDYFSSPV